MTWYYVLNGQQAGPVEDSELQGLAAYGAITSDTLVWRAGMPNWAQYRTLFQAAPPPGAVPCMQCGKGFAEEQTIPLGYGRACATCKPIVLQRIREGDVTVKSNQRFAGFWIRLVARMIDNVITSIAGYIFQIPMLAVMASMGSDPAKLNWWLFGSTAAFAVIMSIVAAGYYEAWFLVKKGATPGKMILGLKVVRARGGEFRWGLAWGRYFAHLLSGLTMYVGYFMAGWDEEKRALHDRICDTRVVFGS